MNTPARGNRYMLCLFLYQITASALFTVVYVVNDYPAWFTEAPMLLVNQVIVLLLPFLVYMFVTKQSLRQILPIKRLGIVNIGLIFFMCVLVQPFMALLSALSSMIFTNNMSELLSSMDNYPFLLTFAIISITPAICEEINLRGIIQTNYNKIDIKKTAIINGLFFGIIHMDLQQFLYAFLIGILFAYFVYYTKSIFASMFAHFTINGIQVCLSYAADGMSEPVQEISANNNMLSVIVSLLTMTLIFLPVFIVLFKSFVSINRRTNLIEDMLVQLTDLSDETENDDNKTTNILTPSFWGVTILFLVYAILQTIVMLFPMS